MTEQYSYDGDKGDYGLSNPSYVPGPSDADVSEKRPKEATEKNKNKTGESERGNWGGSIEFVLSCLGYAVGLGNVWKFPYLVYQNGGGAFLIPYILMMLLVGLPCFFMEMIIGQYSSRGPLHLWALAPIFRGIGFGMVVISYLGSISYNVIMGWSFYFLFASWQTVLPWSTCTQDYNTPECYTKNEASPCESMYNVSNTYLSNQTFVVPNNLTGVLVNETFTNLTSKVEEFWWYNQTCYNSTFCLKNMHMTGCDKVYVEDSRVSASQEYFKKRVLKISNSLDDSGQMQWELVLVLLLAWIVCWACVVKGIKSAGKVVYFTAIFPYVVIFILLIRGALLDGAKEGVIFYINPRWETLANARVWVDAAGQVFYSLGVGAGGLMNFASYNKFNNNIYRDTLIVVFLDTATSIVAGFPIFSIIGHLAKKLGKSVETVVEKGPGLAFIAYPEVVTYLPVSQLWATLFFVMLLTLGVDSQMAGIETIMTALSDAFPVLRKWKPLLAATLCSILFLMGLTMCLQSGEYWLNIMSSYQGGWSAIFIAAFELLIFAWIYGARRILNNLTEMTGLKLWPSWWFLFKFAPILIVAILIFSFVDYSPLTYPNKTDYPVWSQVLGMLIALFPISMIPLVAVYTIYKSYKQEEYNGLNFFQRLLALTRPSSLWMPGPDRDLLEQDMKGNCVEY